ncbi:replication protein RepA [Agromyces humi]|uniref:replication protein RepA n=1 Tax=Agromyces humi TaxID=1766800 RepID=UPI00135B1130|nr:replication protein RepA [Agromyces humi]
MSNPAPSQRQPDPAASKSIAISSERQKLINFATMRELDSTEPERGFSARLWAQVSLPYREPKNVPYWERRNGNVTLTVRPALIYNEETKTRHEAYPFGVIPRHAMTWMATEALKTRDPELDLGRSMRGFMEKLGIKPNGQNAKRLTDHMRRLLGSQMSVEGLVVSEETGRSGIRASYFQVADEVQLWFSDVDEKDNPGLWQSRIRLSDQFYQSIISSPVPVDLGVLNALGSSPMRIDQYIWLTHRMFYLKETSRITWEQLNGQFGAQFARSRTFKERFVKNLQAMQIVYDGLNIDVTDRYLVLKPSRTSVPTVGGFKSRKALKQGKGTTES